MPARLSGRSGPRASSALSKTCTILRKPVTLKTPLTEGLGAKRTNCRPKGASFLAMINMVPQSEARDAIKAVHIDDDRAVAAFDMPDQV